MSPLPSYRFDPVRWEARKADKYGVVEIDSNRYNIGPDMHGRRLDIAIRATRITVKDRAGRTVADLKRVYGKSPRTIQDPGKVFPLIASKPRAWRDCSIRPDVPDEVREYLDQADDRTLKSSLRAIARACEAAGFEPAMQAVSHAITLDWDLNEQEMVPLAKRIADGDIDYGGDLPDLNTYDKFNHPGKEDE